MRSIYFSNTLPRYISTKILTMFSKNFFYTGNSPVVYNKNLPDQDLPGENWVKVRNRLSGVCGTDLSLFFLKPHPKIALTAVPESTRTFLGHEVLGIVEETGSKVTSLKPGDRVTMQKYVSCCELKDISPPCRFCSEGLYCLCENIGEPGPKPLHNMGAGFGDYFLAPEKQLVKVPDTLTDDQAVMIEATAVSVHSVLTAPPEDGEKVLVLGGGTIGLNIVQFLKVVNPNCKVYLMEKVKAKQEFALELGADEILSGDLYQAVAGATGAKLYEGMLHNRILVGGFDKIYDCVGVSATIHDCLRWLRARGTYIKIGHHLCFTEYDETPIWWRELRIIGMNAHGMDIYKGRKISSFDLVIELMEQGKLNVDKFITHRFKLEDYKKAFKFIDTKPQEIIKVVFEIS